MHCLSGRSLLIGLALHFRNHSWGIWAALWHCDAFSKGRGNLDRYILDCFVVELLAMTPRTELICREQLHIFIRFSYFIANTFAA